MDAVTSLLNLMYSNKDIGVNMKIEQWIHTRRTQFEVRTCYCVLHPVDRALRAVIFPTSQDIKGKPLQVLELIAAWGGTRGGVTGIEVGRMVPLCLMWSIWRERFKDCKKTDRIKNIHA